MLEAKGIHNKRASRRYTYLPQARFQAQTVNQGIQIRDISKSGLQFFSNTLIRANTPIIVTWQEPGLGTINPFLMVIRKIDQSHAGIFRYNYGSQFFNLRQDARANIEKILATTKSEEVANNLNLIQKIKVQSLIDIIKEGRSFLHNLIKGNDPEKTFTRFTRDLKDYEKKSFSGSDDESNMIQRLTTHNFHCSLLNIAIPFVSKKKSEFDFYKESVKKIELIGDAVAEARKFQGSALVAESANRLFYNKLELLQTFVEAYESDSANDGNEAVKQIVSEYKQTSPKKPTPRR